MMTQFLAVMQDSLRLLRSRSLFWLSLSLSAIAAIALFSTYTFKPDGLRILWFETWKNPMLSANGTGPADFVGYVFNSIFVKFWLGWGAIILAIISTASILPEFLASGSIDMALSKPISRLRLFAFKIFGAMLFVLLQVAVGVGLAYLIIGLKFDVWMHKSLWTIPLIALQFFYLFSISALIAVITRSTLAAVLGTSLIWFLIFLVQFVSNTIDEQAVVYQNTVERSTSQIDHLRAKAKSESRELTGAETSRMGRLEARAESDGESLRSIQKYQRIFHIIKTPIPKTGDIQVIIASVADAPIANEFLRIMAAGGDGMRPGGMDEDEWDNMNEAGSAAQKARRALNIPVSIGTSVGFCFVCLGLATFIFVRRDF